MSLSRSMLMQEILDHKYTYKDYIKDRRNISADGQKMLIEKYGTKGILQGGENTETKYLHWLLLPPFQTRADTSWKFNRVHALYVVPRIPNTG